MTITLDLNPDIEQGLLAQAQARGISVGDYLQDLVSRQIRATTPAKKPVSKGLKLPALSLGDMGSLHRRDIYDDAR